MTNKINIITGENYTLAELFSEERQIIMPDLQRDYCWGNNNNTKVSGKGELVSDFVNNLIDQFKSKDKESLNLGLLYGYEIPANHIQLCDGQQRITTLFLLLGMINKRTGAFRQHLISDFEYEHDDKEPYLKYAIRESSLYFLSDLVCNFFISNTDPVDKIKTADWYFQDYDLDPSIQSMIKTLEIIETLLTKTAENIDLKEFGDWLLHKLTFMYVDMENRQNGEETFVIINTTGEPLSATENLKPLVIHANINKNIQDVDKWEEIETWFWQHRTGDNDTADAGFNEFLRWITMLHSEEKDLQIILTEKGKYVFPIEKISIDDIYKYLTIIKFLFETWEHKGRLKSEFLSPATNKGIDQIDCFELLPLIAYCHRWEIKNADDRNLYRLYMFLHNLRKINKVKNNVNELVWHAINIARNCNDIIDLADNDFGVSDTLLSKEERLKLKILKDNIDNRIVIEELFWQAQSYKVKSHKIWSGKILPLIEWASNDKGFDANLFKEYLEIFDNTFRGKCNDNIDNVRRALLTRNLKDYPRIFSGYTVYSFGWEWSDWRKLINDNKQEFKSFFDDLRKGITCDKMIEEYKEDAWADFVHDEELMKYCTEKKLQWYNKSWYLMWGTKWSGYHANVNAYKYYLYLKKSGKTFEGWKKAEFWHRDNTCVYYEQSKDQPYVCIDIIWNEGKDNRQVEIDLFMKPTNKAEVAELAEQSLQSVANRLGYTWNPKRYVKYIDITGSEKELYTTIDAECEEILKKDGLCGTEH